MLAQLLPLPSRALCSVDAVCKLLVVTVCHLTFAKHATSCIAVCVYYHCTAAEMCVMMCRLSKALLPPQTASGVAH